MMMLPIPTDLVRVRLGGNPRTCVTDFRADLQHYLEKEIRAGPAVAHSWQSSRPPNWAKQRAAGHENKRRRYHDSFLQDHTHRVTVIRINRSKSRLLGLGLMFLQTKIRIVRRLESLDL